MADLSKAIEALKTPEARAKAIYTISKKEAESEGEKTQLPVCDAECAWHGIALAFMDRRFKVGFNIARRGRIIEDLVSMVEAMPLPQWQYGRDARNEIPEEVKKLPGYKEPDKHDYENRQACEVMGWARSINHALISHILIPEGEHLRAARQMIKMGQRSEAVQHASNTLSPDEVADICEEAQANFGIGIYVAEKNKRPDLEERLKRAAVESVKAGTNEGMMDAPGRFGNAIALVKRYGFGEDEANAILELGIDTLTRQFYGELGRWHSKVRHFEGFSWGFGHRSERSLDQETNTKRERMRYTGQPCPEAKALVDLVKTLPEEKAAAARERIYSACRENGSPFDGFGIALAFGDAKTALEFGIKIMNFRGYKWEYNNCAESIPGIVGQMELLENVGPDEIKNYIIALCGMAYHTSNYRSPIAAAERYGLSVWLMGHLEKSNPGVAAGIAAQIGEREKAKELYVNARQYAHAIECSDDPNERAGFYLTIAMEKIEWRVKYPMTPSYYNRRELNRELEPLVSAAGEVRGVEPGQRYIRAAVGIVDALAGNGDFTEACLFAEESGITLEKFASIMAPETLVEAEKKEDFAGCYHLARLQGDSDAAEGYRLIAGQLEQKVHGKLDDMVFREPEHESRIEN